MELNLDSEGGAHGQLARMNYRIFWPTQRKIKRLREE